VHATIVAPASVGLGEKTYGVPGSVAASTTRAASGGATSTSAP
jgi:hypothetical protein